MYKLSVQNYYHAPENMYIIEAFNDEGKPLKPKLPELESFIQAPIQVGDKTYKIMTVMYDLTTEKYFALCRPQE